MQKHFIWSYDLAEYPQGRFFFKKKKTIYLDYLLSKQCKQYHHVNTSQIKKTMKKD